MDVSPATEAAREVGKCDDPAAADTISGRRFVARDSDVQGRQSQWAAASALPFPMRRRIGFPAIALILSVAVTSLSVVAQRAAPPPRRPGVVEPGITQLPNGWRIAPAGRHAQVGDL